MGPKVKPVVYLQSIAGACLIGVCLYFPLSSKQESLWSAAQILGTASILSGLLYNPVWTLAKIVLEMVDTWRHSEGVVQRCGSANKFYVPQEGACCAGIAVAN